MGCNNSRARVILAPLVAFAALISVTIWPPGCRQKNADTLTAPTAPIVRVRVVENTPEIQLRFQADAQPPLVRTANGAAQRLGLPAGKPHLVKLDPSGWQIGHLRCAVGELIVEPSPEGSLSIDGKAYRGHYRLVPLTDTTFEVVNHVDIDSYLKGVLAKELLPEFLPAAYDAQAIVARTYALYEWKMAPQGRSWDLHDDVRSQVYGGIAAETAKSRAAADRTAGMVVAYGAPGQETIFKAYFSACCGGAGQSAADAFGAPPSEPLSDRRVGHLCADPANRRFTWAPVVVPKDELARRFRAFGRRRGRPEKDIADVARIDIFRTNPSGRPTHFVVYDVRGASYMMNGEELRWAVNTDVPEGSNTTLLSSYVKPVATATAIRFEDGHGWGHGVGLCQWCAHCQAKQGVAHEQIVLSAYKGARLVKAYDRTTPIETASAD